MRENVLPATLLSKEKIELILKSIKDGNIQYIEHVRKENFHTQNGKYHEIWNYIFKNIESNFNDFPYKCYKILRGKLWSFIAIYNEESSILYILMKKERIKEIKNKEDNDYHYSRILNYINNPFQYEQKEQLSMFPQDNDKEEYIKEDLQRMIREINGEVKLCVDILFSEKEGRAISISGNVFDYNLDSIKSECWDEYIKVDIDEIIDISDELNVENPPIQLGIKKRSRYSTLDKKKEDTEDIVASKEKQKKKLE